MTRMTNKKIGRIVEPRARGETCQAYDVIRSGEHWIVLLPLNENSCSPSVNRIQEIRDAEAGEMRGSWWRQAVIGLLDKERSS